MADFIEIIGNLKTVPVKAFIPAYKHASASLYPEDTTQAEIEALSCLFQDPEMIDFVIKLTAEQLGYSLQCVGDLEPAVTVEAISDLEKMWKFVKDLKSAGETYR